MIKKTITYTDLDGNKITEDFYFNLNKGEIAEMELSRKGGLMYYLKSILKAEDSSAIIEAFKMIISKAYGQRSEDGKSFIKTEKNRDWFLGTDAYSELFMELAQDAEKGASFIRGLMPSDLIKQFDEVVASENETPPPWIVENRDPTPKELQSMTKDQIVALMQRSIEKKADPS